MDHVAPLGGGRGARGTAGFLLRLHRPWTAGQARGTRQGRPTTWPTGSVAEPWNETLDRFEFDRAPHAVRVGTPPQLARREEKGSGTVVVQEGRDGGGCGHAFVAAASRPEAAAGAVVKRRPAWRGAIWWRQLISGRGVEFGDLEGFGLAVVRVRRGRTEGLHTKHDPSSRDVG
jgi:hypothetical protein